VGVVQLTDTDTQAVKMTLVLHYGSGLSWGVAWVGGLVAGGEWDLLLDTLYHFYDALL
jgi:hypothetical protein